MRIAVVGAGIVGLSTAYALASRRHQVTLYERFPLFHDRGSSHGRSRIVRRAYSDAFYTGIMAEAYPMWRDLERASGRTLLHECGLVYFGPADAPRVVDVQTGLENLQVSHQVYGATSVRRVFPDLSLDPDEVGIWTPEAGWVAADLALRALHDLSVAQGVDVRDATPVDPHLLAAEYDVVIAAMGPWLPTVRALPTTVTRQTVAYVDAQIPGPVWIDDVGLTYGFPSDGIGQKIGAHLPGPMADPEDTNRPPDPAQLAQIREAAKRRFGIQDPQFREVLTCHYTNTADEDFRMGRFALNGFFASACSGHGFKMGLWVGRCLADFAEGKDSPERHPRFFLPDPSP